MGVVNNQYVTVADWASRTTPDGSPDVITEMLLQNHPEFEDINYIEGNLPLGHQGTVRSGLPEPSFRRAYQGTPFTKSRTEQVISGCAVMEDWSRFDELVANLNGNRASTRFNEDIAHLQGMVKKWGKTFFYGDATNSPDEFTGLAPRYASGAPSVDNSRNMINAGGSSNANTSIWFVTYGERHLHGIYPKGSPDGSGLMMNDLGYKAIIDDQTYQGGGVRQYMGYETHFKLLTGLHQQDWRTTSRICNLDITELEAGNYDMQLSEWMIRAFNALEQTFVPMAASNTRTFCYMNRNVKTRFDVMQQSREVSSSATPPSRGNIVRLTPGEWAGRPVETFWEIPIRVTDSLVNNESNVPFA